MAEQDDSRPLEDDAPSPESQADEIYFVEQSSPPGDGDSAATRPGELSGEELNPYAPPVEAGVSSAGELLAAKTAVALPQPNLLVALLLVVLLIVMQIVFVVAGAKVLSAVGGGSLSLADLSVQLVPVATFATVATGLLVALVMFRERIARKLALRGCTPLQWFLLLLLLAPQSMLAGEIANWAMELMRLLDQPWLDRLNDMGWIAEFSRLPWPLVFVAACLFPGVGEEIFFRGVLSRGLVARHGIVAGALITSVMFGVIHVAPAQVAGTIMIGLMLQMVFMTTRSLTAAIALHTVNNAMAFLMVQHGELLPISGYTVEVPGEVSHVPATILLAALVMTALVLALFYQTRTRWITADGGEWRPGFFATEMPPADLQARPVCGTPHPLLLAGALLATVALVAAVWLSLSA
jgi:membrane protease YdiL (CAAX protease family)